MIHLLPAEKVITTHTLAPEEVIKELERLGVVRSDDA